MPSTDSALRNGLWDRLRYTSERQRCSRAGMPLSGPIWLFDKSSTCRRSAMAWVNANVRNRQLLMLNVLSVEKACRNVSGTVFICSDLNARSDTCAKLTVAGMAGSASRSLL
ncbi:hypothetical protein PPS11_40198 [Pseudomonas putida S11]|nr:hypothetical protein PPS11_40198 [Pseudomonas putida S11]